MVMSVWKCSYLDIPTLPTNRKTHLTARELQDLLAFAIVNAEHPPGTVQVLDKLLLRLNKLHTNMKGSSIQLDML